MAVLLLLAVIMFGVLALVFARALTPSHWSHQLIVTSILTGAAWLLRVAVGQSDDRARAHRAGAFALALALAASAVDVVVREAAKWAKEKRGCALPQPPPPIFKA